MIINKGVIMSPIPELDCCSREEPPLVSIMVDIISLKEDRKSDVEEAVLVVCVDKPVVPKAEEVWLMLLIIVLPF